MATSWTIDRKEGPARLPVSLQDAKKHLRISGSGMDDRILSLCHAATEQLEKDTERSWIAQTYVQTYDSFPRSGGLQLNNRPVTEVVSVSYLDSDGAPVVMDAAQYRLDTGRRVIFPATGEAWPETIVDPLAVSVEFIAGLESVDCVPYLAKEAILLELGRLFFDPAQENLVNTNDGRSYEAIVRKLMRSSYP